MALPSTVGDSISNASWPTYLNGWLGPMRARAKQVLTSYELRNSSDTFGGSTLEKVAQGFQLSADADVYSVQAFVGKSNSPTDDLILEIQSDSAGVPSGTVLASVTKSGADITVSKLHEFVFASPVSLSSGTAYWVVLRRSGSLDSINRWTVGWQSSGGYTGGNRATFASSTWTVVANTDWQFRINGGDQDCIYVFGITTGPRLTAFRSDDEGDTWSRRDSTIALDQSVSGYRKGGGIDGEIIVGFASNMADVDGNHPSYLRYDLQWGRFDRNLNDTPGGIVANGVAGTPHIHGASRSDQDVINFYNSTTERIMGTDYRRVVYGRLEGSTITGQISVGGTGVQQHHDARAIVRGSSDRIHFFWTDTANGDLKHRSLTSGNTLNGIQDIDTNVNVGSYSVGLPTVYDDGVDVKIVVPYVDSTNELRAARAISADSPTWDITEAISATSTSNPEVTASNPGAVSADGAEVFAFWPDDSTQDIWRDRDLGAGSWGADVEWKDAVTCNAISINVIENEVGVVYRDGTTVKFDLFVIRAPSLQPENGIMGPLAVE